MCFVHVESDVAFKPPTILQIRNCLFLVTWVVTSPLILPFPIYHLTFQLWFFFKKNITLKNIYLYIYLFCCVISKSLGSPVFETCGILAPGPVIKPILCPGS